MAPNSADRSPPELIVTTGMPASTAAAMDSWSGEGFLGRVRVGHRPPDPVYVLVDRGVDELRLPLRIAVAPVVDRDAQVLAGRLGPILHDVPEGATRRTVGDHGEGAVAPTAASTGTFPPEPSSPAEQAATSRGAATAI